MLTLGLLGRGREAVSQSLIELSLIQSERAYYLSYFINNEGVTKIVSDKIREQVLGP